MAGEAPRSHGVWLGVCERADNCDGRERLLQREYAALISQKDRCAFGRRSCRVALCGGAQLCPGMVKRNIRVGEEAKLVLHQ